MPNIYFKESQKVNLGWKWILFLGLYALMIWALLEQFSEQKYDVTGVISIVFSICVFAFFNILILCMKLEVEINNESINFRFKPFHLNPRIIEIKDIDKIYIREFKPYFEYGGHGIQRKFKYGRSYTVSGKIGLQLVLKNDKKILIGSQKPKELAAIIDKIKTTYKII